MALVAVGLDAESATAAESTLVERAQAEIDRASRQYRSGEYEAALGSLRRAETLAEKAEDPSLPSIRFNIARCLEKLERWDDALRAYRRYNELPDASHRKERAFEAIESLEKKVYATLAIACDPPGSSLEIPDVAEGSPSCPWRNTRMEPGSYSVKVSHPGYVSTTELIDLEAGQQMSLEVSLQRDPKSPLSAATTPAARRFRPWPWVALAGGAAAAAVGVGFTAGALGERDAAEELPPGPERDEAVDAFETKRATAYVAFGVGGALVATGIVLFLLKNGHDDEASKAPGAVALSGTGLQVRF